MTVLVDANILLYAKFVDYEQHEKARSWLDQVLNAPQPVAIPWVCLSAFIRIATNPRVFKDPLTTESAVQQTSEWCSLKMVWHPQPLEGFVELYSKLLVENQCTGNLVPDAYVATLALQHGLAVVSSDSDFARFPTVTWYNPLA